MLENINSYKQYYYLFSIVLLKRVVSTNSGLVGITEDGKEVFYLPRLHVLCLAQMIRVV